MDNRSKLQRVKEAIASFPDFPKPGINFKDIFPILRDPEAFRDLIDLFEDHVRSLNVDAVVGLEARGFLLGPILALKLGLPFIPIRKKGKLPGETIQVSFQLEYGEDVFEAQVGSVKPGQKVVIVDDLLATGGTLKAAHDLVVKMEGIVQGCLVVIELKDLQGRVKIPANVHSLFAFADSD